MPPCRSLGLIDPEWWGMPDDRIDQWLEALDEVPMDPNENRMVLTILEDLKRMQKKQQLYIAYGLTQNNGDRMLEPAPKGQKKKGRGARTRQGAETRSELADRELVDFTGTQTSWRASRKTTTS